MSNYSEGVVGAGAAIRVFNHPVTSVRHNSPLLITPTIPWCASDYRYQPTERSKLDTKAPVPGARPPPAGK
ncbi:hypothetical protein QFZ70_000340 [Arthrobacter sp. V1I9]|nr:hypothetical protein [Arthrobacter sp. V1I9]